MAATVTLWTTGEPGAATGLTVSSMLVAGGRPWRVLGLIDPDADIVDGLRDTGRVVVNILRWPHRALADAFAGVGPAPGGPFRLAEWVATPWGPAVSDASAWAGCSVIVEPQQVGWSLLVQADVEHVQLNEDDAPLVHRRGRYFTT
jgi:flavin reductase (DIM6/NTAB) family NADH-FMN oxidoreductase RutF